MTKRFHNVRFAGFSVRSHRKAHKVVITNERWYGKGPPFLGKSFTRNKAIRRHRQIRKILGRAQRRELRNGNDALAKAYSRLQTRLKNCRPGRRCGFSICPKCARAFQRAKVAGHLDAIGKQRRKKLVLVTIIPRQYAREPGHFLDLNPLKANRWLRDVLERNDIRRAVIGSIDFGWEKRAGVHYLQLHWHLAMWTSNPKKLKAKLERAFKTEKTRQDPRFKRPIDVRVADDLDFIPYVHKLIKLPKILRSGRRQLPKLALLLGRYDSMDFIFLRKTRLSAQSAGIVFQELGKIAKTNS